MLVSESEYIVVSPDIPIIQRTYYLEDATTGTGAQNRAFHALIGEYFRTGLHSYPARSFAEFRDFVKRDLGAGFESFVYASPEGVVKVKTREEIPAEYNNSKYAMGRLKSWADYTLKERRETMDRLISEMNQAGVNTTKYQEILIGMERKQ
jgi:hypothetical protein